MSTIYSIIDIETTGSHKKGHKITEIAIINYDGTNIIEEFSTLINPEQNIPYSITHLTGIDNQMVETAPKFYQVAKKIIEMTENSIFVAHNVYFDYNFIKYEFSELGYSFSRPRICTVRTARKLIPGHKSYSLGKICDDLNIPITARHRAMGDAQATLKLFKILLSKGELHPDFQSKQLSLPSTVSQEKVDSLPEKPGIYYFYDKDHNLLYIGKSKNIKKRVLTHFRVDLKRKKDIELKNQISEIDFTILGNELAALILEANEIKLKRPHFNRALNRIRTPYALKLNKKDLYSIEVVSSKTHPEAELKFGSRKSAQNKRNSLYQAFLGVDADGLFFEKTIEQRVNILGQKQYNLMLEKIFFSRQVNTPNYHINLKGRTTKEKCIIEVKDHFPQKVIFTGKSGINKSYEIIAHEDMKNIMEAYIYKHKIKIHQGESHQN
ncbi:MAG: DNA polymerase III subunit epsilon [Halobacteriovoraceae bacterium]|nr:DNA polymerase III subunit epsilon [Halobacteriovoraceae bacterium]|tara:strand:- start:2548 stop:3861 length:1314 start_codon:yes stop_codon:yes gene_type:complete